MAIQITNMASVSFTYGETTGTATSNLATATLLDRFSIDKNSLSTTYRVGDDVTYTVTVTNASSSEVTCARITDDLGAYTIGNVRVVPLTYLAPAQLYIDGIYDSDITAEVGDRGAVFTVTSIPAGATALILYRATVNSYAPIGSGASVTNTVMLNSTSQVAGDDVPTASFTIYAEEYADVRIVKSMSPDPISEGDEITYNFDIYNYGVVEASNVVLTDAFNPIPTNISVYVDGDLIAVTDYTYENGTLTIPADTSSINITVPAATVSQDATSGLVNVIPGHVNITVTGTL